MKKVIVFIAAITLMMIFSGCNQTKSDREPTSDAATNKWGITLDVENVSSTGMTLVCHQAGGEEVFELNTGSFYGIQTFENSQWVDITDEDQIWTSVAWMIQKGSTTKWDINWVGFCGELPAGEYRIVKPITNFRGTGDYDTETFYAEFTID